MGGISKSSKDEETPKWVHAMAGGLAGAVSRLVVGPLDVVKIRMQVQLEPIARGAHSKYSGVVQALSTIVKEEGVQGLWRGTTPALGLTVPYCAVQFAVLNQCKAIAAAQGWNDSKWASVASFVSGSTAGAVATFVSYPLDLLRTVLASQGSPPLYRGMIDAGKAIVKQNGPKGLFTGVGITLLEIVPYAGIQFGVYDFLNRTTNNVLTKDGTRELSSPIAFSRHFLVGLLAGLISKSVTHPLDVVKKRYQVTGLRRPLTYGARVSPEATARLSTCVRTIWIKEGAAGFFKGLTPSLVKAAPASAVTFAAYELFLGALTALPVKNA